MPMNVFDPHFRLEQTSCRYAVSATSASSPNDGSSYVLWANVVQPAEALRYVWSRPVSTIVSGMESEALLDANIAAARAFQPMSAEEQAALLERTRQAGADGKFEPYKFAPNFDGPVGRKLHGVR